MGKNFSRNNAKKTRRKSDLYETPYSMTSQLLDVVVFKGSIFEPSCGKGAIVKVLKKRGYKNIRYSDLDTGHDFLKYKGDKFNCVVTNPPFSLAYEFLLKAKKVAKKKIAFLLPLNYLHGIQRYEGWYSNVKFKLKYVYVFVRAPMFGDKLRKDGKYRTGMMVMAWYIWSRKYSGDPKIRWINNNKYVLKGKKDVR